MPATESPPKQSGWQRAYRDRKHKDGYCIWNGCWKKHRKDRVFCKEHAQWRWHRAGDPKRKAKKT